MVLTDPPMVYGTAVEGLYLRGLRGRITAPLQVELARMGIDLEKPLLPAYPLELWDRALRATCQALFGDRPMDEGMEELGRLAFTGYRETPVGRAVYPLLKLLGPTRVLTRMSRNFQNANNYTETRLSQSGENDVQLWMSNVIHPAFYRGVLVQAVAAAGASEVMVEVGSREGSGCNFQIRWK